MRKRTTSKQLNSAIKDNLLHIVKAEVYYKTSRETETIDTDNFKDSLDFLCETIFADSIGWYYEKNYATGDYEIDCSRMDRSSDIVIIAHLRANEEDIERILKIEEE